MEVRACNFTIFETSRMSPVCTEIAKCAQGACGQIGVYM